MNESQPQPEAVKNPNQKAEDLLVQWNEWKDLLAYSGELKEKLARDEEGAEVETHNFLADVAFKAEEKPSGETIHDQINDAQRLIQQSAHKVEEEIAAARGVDFNPADSTSS